MSNYVGFQVIFKKDVFGIVVKNVATTTSTSSKSDDVTICFGSISKLSEDSESDDSDGDEPSTEDIQEADQVVYNNWLKVYKVNKSLKEKIVKLTKKKSDEKSSYQL